MDVPNFVMGLGSLIAGLSSLNNAFKKKPRGGTAGLGKLAMTGQHTSINGGPSARIFRVDNIDDRLAAVAQMVMISIRDPRVRQLAVSIVSKRCNEPNHKTGDGGWCLDERDYWGEVQAIFYWMRANVRYVRDPATIDTFATAMRTIEARGGDCLPEGTLILKAPGILVPIENIEVGDSIYDGERFVRVLNHWDKGTLPTLDFKLNNGSVIRCTGEHGLFVVPRIPAGNRRGEFESAERIKAEDVRVGADLLQPVTSIPFGVRHLQQAEATLVGAYLAEGWTETSGRISIAGIANSKMLRERVMRALHVLGWTFRESDRAVHLHVNEGAPAKLLGGLGRVALEKHFDHLDYDEATMREIVSAMENGDAGISISGMNLVYSTISEKLAVQYRIVQRMLGRSTSVSRVDEHGGLGTHPIYRVTVRSDSVRRPWAKVRSISEGPECHVYDFQTESGRIYLPEQDVIVHNCDDYQIALAALLMTIGYPVKMKTIRTKDFADWNHIYLVVGLPPGKPTKWRALDASVKQPAGWEAPASIIAQSRVDSPDDRKWVGYF